MCKIKFYQKNFSNVLNTKNQNKKIERDNVAHMGLYRDPLPVAACWFK